MIFKIINLWKEKKEFPELIVCAFTKVDCQYCAVFLNFSFILDDLKTTITYVN